MKRADLTKYQQIRLSKARVCPLCGKEIYNDDELEFEARPLSKSKVYIFYHAECRKGVKNYGKEIKETAKEREFSQTSEYAIFRKIWEEVKAEKSCTVCY